jgi:hypothetical protein
MKTRASGYGTFTRVNAYKLYKDIAIASGQLHSPLNEWQYLLTEKMTVTVLTRQFWQLGVPIAPSSCGIIEQGSV